MTDDLLAKLEAVLGLADDEARLRAKGGGELADAYHAYHHTAADLLRDHGPAIRQAMTDAERYAWLRKFSDNGGAVKPMVPTLTWAGPYTEGWHADLDAAIDAARATGEGEGHDPR